MYPFHYALVSLERQPQYHFTVCNTRVYANKVAEFAENVTPNSYRLLKLVPRQHSLDGCIEPWRAKIVRVVKFYRPERA